MGLVHLGNDLLPRVQGPSILRIFGHEPVQEAQGFGKGFRGQFQANAVPLGRCIILRSGGVEERTRSIWTVKMKQ